MRHTQSYIYVSDVLGFYGKFPVERIYNQSHVSRFYFFDGFSETLELEDIYEAIADIYQVMRHVNLLCVRRGL